MYKVIVQRLTPDETPDEPRATSYMQTIYDFTSESAKVVADTLRSIANELDPPSQIKRRDLPTIYRGQE